MAPMPRTRAHDDGVELHGAFGDVIDQFLQDISNRRDDAFGGSAPIRDVARSLRPCIGTKLLEQPAFT